MISLARFFIYTAIASPLIVSRELFFPFITGKALFFRGSVALGLLFSLGAILFGSIRKDEVLRIIKQPLVIATALFTALFMLSCAMAVNPSFAFWSNFERGEGGWQMIHYFVFFLLLSLLFRSEGDWRRVIGWQVIVSSLVALYAVGQAANWLPSFILNPPAGAISGTLGNPSYLGGYMMFSMIFAAWLAFNKKPRIGWLWFMLGIFQLIIFFAAKTRGSFVALSIGIIIMTMLWAWKEKKEKYTMTSIIIALMLIIAGIGYLVTTVKGNIWISFQPRLWTGESAIAGVIEKPLFGWGPENFPFVFDRYYNPKHYGIESWFDRAHNALLEYATGGGIPLVLAYIGMFFVLYWLLIHMQRRTEVWVVFMALPAMYLVNGLVLFEILPLYVVLFLLMAFSLHYAHNFALLPYITQRRTPLSQFIHAPFVSLFFVVITIFTGVSLHFTIYLPLHKNRLILTALQPNNKTDEQVFSEYESALSYPSPIGKQEATQTLLEFTEVYIDFLKKNLEIPPPPEKIKQVIDFNELWYQKNNGAAVGVKPMYAYARTLIAATRATNDKNYLKQAHILIDGVLKQAPTRIEFVKLAMEAAALERDQAAYDRALKQGKRLRLDLEWKEMKI